MPASTRCSRRSPSATGATRTSAASRATRPTRPSTSTSPSNTRRTRSPGMPELPDLLYVMGILRPALIGRTVGAARLTAPVVLRSLVKGDLSLLVGRALDEVLRSNHFLVFRFGDLDLAVNPMLAGRFKLAEPPSRMEAAAALVLTLVPGPALRYLDDKKMGQAHLPPAGPWKDIHGEEGGGNHGPIPSLTM